MIALKTLCGFDVGEIAQRLFTTEADVYKRLGRARNRLRELAFEPGHCNAELVSSRLPAVQLVSYLIFSEGYLSYAEPAIRGELCDEARRRAVVTNSQFDVQPRARRSARAGLQAPIRQDLVSISCHCVRPSE